MSWVTSSFEVWLSAPGRTGGAGCDMKTRFCAETRLRVRIAQDSGRSARTTAAQLHDERELGRHTPSLRTIQRWRRGHRERGQPLALQKPIRRASRTLSQQQTSRDALHTRLAKQRSRKASKTKDLRTDARGSAGWQIVRGCCHRKTGNVLRASPAERALRATLPVRVLKTARQRVRRQYVARTEENAFAYNRLFRTQNRSDPNRFIWHDLQAKDTKLFFAVSTAVAAALHLPGTPSEISLIISTTGAREQHKHVDIDARRAFSFLFALTRRYIHVDDQDSGVARLVRLDAGDLLILRGGTCHGASHHPLRRKSTLIFVAYNFNTENATTFCSA